MNFFDVALIFCSYLGSAQPDVTTDSAYIPAVSSAWALDVPAECWKFASTPGARVCNLECLSATERDVTDFDRLNLALNLELMEYSLFDQALQTFTSADWLAAGLPNTTIPLLEEMRTQEVGHSTRLQYFLNGRGATQPCIYDFPFTNVPEFTALSRSITSVGEAYYLGFMHLLSDCQAQQAAETIVVNEAVQNAVFRTWSGLSVFGGTAFGSALTARQAWTMASAYVYSCPVTNPIIRFRPFPAIQVDLKGGNGKPGTVIGLIPVMPGLVNIYEARYAAFITETGVRFAPFNPVTRTTRIPDLRGVVFVALVSDIGSGYQLDDSLVVAGPAPLTIS